MIVFMTSSEDGFTIIEILIAMAIFAIGILGVAKMQLSSIRGNTSARTITEAVSHAQGQMERLLSLPYDNTDLDDTNNDGTNQDTDDDGVDDDGGNFGLDNVGANADHTWTSADGIYNVSWNIAVDEPVTACKRIRVIVSWQAGGRAAMQRTLDAIKCAP